MSRSFLIGLSEFDGSFLSARAGLKAEITKLVEPHRWTNTKPPFSTGELIVMAIVFSEQEYISRRKILSCIVATFKYYNTLAIEDWLGRLGDRRERYIATGKYELDCIIPGYMATFDELEMPLILQHELLDDSWYGTQQKYSVDARSARRSFSRWLEPKRLGHFRFLDLPAELRNVIYDMTLQGPRAGLSVIKLPEGCMVRTMQREHEKELPMATAWQGRKRFIELGPAQEVQKFLALTLVCKQIHKETATTFYDINAFYFPTFADFMTFHRKLPPKTSSGVRRIFLRPYRYGGDLALWPAVTAALAKHKSYDSLHLEFSDKEWLDMDYDRKQSFRRKRDFAKICHIPGFDQVAIAASKAKEFVLHGDCPKIKAFVDEEVKKLKTGVGKASKPPKRRAKAVLDKDANGGQITAKKGRKA